MGLTREERIAKEKAKIKAARKRAGIDSKEPKEQERKRIEKREERWRADPGNRMNWREFWSNQRMKRYLKKDKTKE